MNNNTFIFLCGLHKSGTSLLFKILREHSLVSGFRDTGVPEDEGQHLQTVFNNARYYGGPGKFGFHPDAHLDENSRLLTDQNRIKLLAEWSQYWDMKAPFLIEKSPPNIVRSRFLQEMFPKSYFIAIIRHPVATSSATMKMTTSSFEEILKHWLVCHDIVSSDFFRIKKKILIRYESLVSNQTAVISNLCDFLDIAYEPIEQPIFTDLNEKYFTRWEKNLSRAGDKTGIQKLKQNYENRFRAYGYSLNSLDLASTKQNINAFKVL